MSRRSTLSDRLSVHESQTERLSDSPEGVKYIENYYAKKSMSLQATYQQVDNINTGIERGLTQHIKEGIRLRREQFTTVYRVGPTERHEIWHGIAKLIWRDTKGRFAKRG